jgi:hypothetical protein
MPKKLLAAVVRSTHVAGFIPVVPAGSVVMNRHDDSIRLALNGRSLRGSRSTCNLRYLRRQSRAIVGGHAASGEWPLERRPLGLGSFRWAEPTLRDWMRWFLAGALGLHPAAVSSGRGTSARFVPRPGGLVSVQAADSRRCRSRACASEISESDGEMMAQKASKKLPLCATFLAFPRHFRWLANDVSYTHGLEAPI